jgi:hypothetical protein
MLKNCLSVLNCSPISKTMCPKYRIIAFSRRIPLVQEDSIQSDWKHSSRIRHSEIVIRQLHIAGIKRLSRWLCIEHSVIDTSVSKKKTRYISATIEIFDQGIEKFPGRSLLKGIICLSRLTSHHQVQC